MTNQFPTNATPASPWHRLTIVLAGLLMAFAIAFFTYYLLQWRDPYIRQVLATPGSLDNGQIIFQINCAGCHGLQGDGLVGPSLKRVSHRRSKLSIIQQVIGGKTPPMPKFQPSPEIMADLLEYLEDL